MALQRSTENRMIAGVCGGIAEWLGWETTVTRTVCAIATLVSGGLPGIVAYALLWFAMPEAPWEHTVDLSDDPTP